MERDNELRYQVGKRDERVDMKDGQAARNDKRSVEKTKTETSKDRVVHPKQTYNKVAQKNVEKILRNELRYIPDLAHLSKPSKTQSRASHNTSKDQMQDSSSNISTSRH